MSANKLIICADGAARGNPGPAAIGATIKDEKGNLIGRISRRIGITTNNQAEYRAIIAALEKAISLGAKYVELKTDSELVVKQINGRYKVKKAVLRPLYQKVIQLIGSLEGFTIAHILREQNAEADELANKALNIVANLPYAECYELTINLKETNDSDTDIANLNQIINIIKAYPGKDEIKLSITNDTNTTCIKLSNIHVNYCPELHEKLVQFIGKKRLKIGPIS